MWAATYFITGGHNGGECEDRGKAVALASEFTREFFPRMYKPVAKSKIIGKQMIDSYGFAGILIDLVLVGLPVLMVLNAKLIKKNGNK